MVLSGPSALTRINQHQSASISIHELLRAARRRRRGLAVSSATAILKGKHSHRGFFLPLPPTPTPTSTSRRLADYQSWPGEDSQGSDRKSRCALFGASASGLRERRGGQGIVREGLSRANGSNNLVRFSPLRNLYSSRWWVDVSPVSCCALPSQF